jgi:hypothetical protein
MGSTEFLIFDNEKCPRIFPYGSPLNVIGRLVTAHEENSPTACPITQIMRGQLLNKDFRPSPSSAYLPTVTSRLSPRTPTSWQLASLQLAAGAHETAALEAAAMSRTNVQLLDIDTQDFAYRPPLRRLPFGLWFSAQPTLTL